MANWLATVLSTVPGEKAWQAEFDSMPRQLPMPVRTIAPAFYAGNLRLLWDNPELMNTEQVKKFCLSFAGSAGKMSGPPSNILTYSVGDKRFAYFKTSEPEIWRFSIRVTPDRFLELTDQRGIKPARYMHRFRWVSIVSVASVQEVYLRELIDWSYIKALSSLPKKIQADIAARG